MEIEFDPAKDVGNITKHGMSLAEAVNLEWDSVWTFGEVRMIGYTYLGHRLHCVIYTDRGNSRRIISLRKANNREEERYASA